MLNTQNCLRLSWLSFQLVPSFYKTKRHVDSSFILRNRVNRFIIKMSGMRFGPFILLIVLGYFCVATNSNPLTSLFGKSDDKAEAGDKVVAGAASVAKAEATTTTTPEPNSSCGGLKGFLHICEKTDSTEPPKSVKTRSVSDDSDSDEDDSESDDDSDESDEKQAAKEENQKPAATFSEVSEATEGKISKRQVGDPEAPILGEVPPVLTLASEVPEESAEKPEEDGETKKRQVDASDSASDSDEDETEEKRRRRDCRDNEDDNEKDCRRKREYVPGFKIRPKNNPTPA